MQIPDNWNQKKLREISYKISDGIHTTPIYTDESEFSFINGNNIKNNRIELYNKTKKVDFNEYKKYYRPFGDMTILMSINGTIGNTAFYRNEKVILGKSVAFINLKDTVDKTYISYYLNTERIKKYWENELTGSTIKNLSLKSIKNTNIYLPPLPEQRAIADILSTWDEAIETMEKLIEAKEKRFRGLLNKLLNNPGSDWRNVSLGDIGEISSAGVDKKINEDEIPVRLINYLDVYRMDHIYSENLAHEVTAPEAKAKKCKVKQGDVFFTPTSEVNYDIAHSAVAMEDISDAVYSYHVVRLRIKEEWDLLFKAYAFKSNYFYKQSYQYCEGSGQRYVISQKSFRKMRVYIPPVEKQKQIGQILFNAQNEVKVLKNISEKYKEQKRGLMQKLLTGEWRVKV